MSSKRAPDPFRPGEVDEGRPAGILGRPAFAAVVIGAIVLIAVVIVIVALAR